jgi:hypothetical protein
MDSGTIIITVVFIAIVTTPFVLTTLSNKRKKKNLFRRLSEMAESEDCTITQQELCGNFVIGFDGMAGRFFFLKKTENLEISKSVNLREFKSCRLINSNRTVGDKKSSYSVVDKLELCFYPKDKSKPDISVELYNDEYDSLTLSGELQLAEKWEKLLNERMKTPKNVETGTGTQPATTAAAPNRRCPQKRVAV